MLYNIHSTIEKGVTRAPVEISKGDISLNVFFFRFQTILLV